MKRHLSNPVFLTLAIAGFFLSLYGVVNFDINVYTNDGRLTAAEMATIRDEVGSKFASVTPDGEIDTESAIYEAAIFHAIETAAADRVEAREHAIMTGLVAVLGSLLWAIAGIMVMLKSKQDNNLSLRDMVVTSGFFPKSSHRIGGLRRCETSRGRTIMPAVRGWTSNP